MTEHVDWLVVPGSGAHIRSGPGRLIVSQHDRVTEYDLDHLSHLLLAGRHTIQTATVARLVRHGVRISFLDPDGEPVGVLRGAGEPERGRLARLQERLPSHGVALSISAYTAHARLGLLGEMGADFYTGELDVLRELVAELPNLIRLQELRRAHRLVGDMYYEIVARSLPADLGFRRRTRPPYLDPVNALLSLSYGLLSAGILASCIGARLDPSIGPLSQGERGLVYDLGDCFRTEMVDRTLFFLLKGGLQTNAFDRTADRCQLSEVLVQEVARHLRTSIDQARIDRQVELYVGVLEGDREFVVV
ncbi:CRISPR-associated endonuclease Cas1 [anaerobic digester metagenome]